MQAGLNVLREEWRRVRDIHRQIEFDTLFKERSPEDWHRLLVQARIDRDELAKAIRLIELVMHGQLLMHDPLTGETGPWADVPVPAGAAGASKPRLVPAASGAEVAA